MTDELRISDVRFTTADKNEKQNGLLGWVTCLVNGKLRLDGIAVRRTLDGRLVLSFPAHRDGKGQQHFFVCPLNDATRRHIENAILTAIRHEEVAR